MVSVSWLTTTNGINAGKIYVNDFLVASEVNQGGTGNYAGVWAIIPPNSKYKFIGPITIWTELS